MWGGSRREGPHKCGGGGVNPNSRGSRWETPPKGPHGGEGRPPPNLVPYRRDWGVPRFGEGGTHLGAHRDPINRGGVQEGGTP